ALMHSLAVLEEAAVEEASNSQWYQREGS
ncbi:hypothetical protein L195_g062849, partial [Trifolium pratense]